MILELILILLSLRFVFLLVKSFEELKMAGLSAAGTCANIEGDGCSNPATNTCSRCYSVQVRFQKFRSSMAHIADTASFWQYCTEECQVSHWQKHKSDCKSSLLQESWKPSWARESRQPAFINDE